MKTLKDGQIIDSPWQLIRKTDAIPDKPWLLIPMTSWLELPAESRMNANMAPWLDAEESVEDLSDFIKSLPLIGLNFPSFTDGRPYSSAWLIRNRYAFDGELLALGDVRYDELEQMMRTGFDSFEVQPQDNFARAIAQLEEPSFRYQLSA